MSFLKNLLRRNQPDALTLAHSTDRADYAQIELLGYFEEARGLHPPSEQQRWNRTLSRSYAETVDQFVKQGWLTRDGDNYVISAEVEPTSVEYRKRQEEEKTVVMPKVRAALEARDTGEALEIRRQYEARQPLGEAAWSGPEPQLSHSALTRRILFLDHWLLDGLSQESVDWLKLYAAEQHLWGAYWRLTPAEIPSHAQEDLASEELGVVEAAYWRAYQLALLVDNQETWQRCKGGDHVRRLEIINLDDAQTCEACQEHQGQQYLVARAPELPHRTCTSRLGCRCRYAPVLESYADLAS